MTDCSPLLTVHLDRAEADGAARAKAIVEGVDPQHADALEYMIRVAIRQFYFRGATDALSRMKEGL